MRRLLLSVVLAAFLVPLPATAASQTVVKTFHLKYRSAPDVSQLVQPLLSDQGSLTIHPRRKLLTVQDEPGTVRMITEVLAAVDVPPPIYRLRVELLEASNAPQKKTAGRVRVDPRVRRMFPYTSFERLAETVLEWDAPGPIRADLGRRYVLQAVAVPRRFRATTAVSRSSARSEKASPSRDKSSEAAQSIGPNDLLATWRLGGRSLLRSLLAHRRVVLENLTLTAAGAGKGRKTETVEVLRTNVVLSPSQRLVLAASPEEHARKALILILKALPVRGKS